MFLVHNAATLPFVHSGTTKTSVLRTALRFGRHWPYDQSLFVCIVPHLFGRRSGRTWYIACPSTGNCRLRCGHSLPSGQARLDASYCSRATYRPSPTRTCYATPASARSNTRSSVHCQSQVIIQLVCRQMRPHTSRTIRRIWEKKSKTWGTLGPIHTKDARFFCCGNSAADISKSHTFKWDPLADEVLEAAWSSPTEKRRPPTCPI